MLGTHIDGLEEDGQLTRTAAAELRRLLEQARGELSTLVTGLDGVTVELQQVGDAIAGSSFNARLVVENSSNRRLTQVAAALSAPDGWGVRLRARCPARSRPARRSPRPSR